MGPRGYKGYLDSNNMASVVLVHQSPVATLTAAIQIASKKALKLSVLDHLFMAIMGGYWVGIFGHAGLCAGSAIIEGGGSKGVAIMLFACIFNTALAAIVLTGSDLVTSNMFYICSNAIDAIKRKQSPSIHLMKAFCTSILGNFIGVVIAIIVSYMAGGAGILLNIIAEKKMDPNAKFITTFFRGIIANTFVVCATFLILAANSVEGKIIAGIPCVVAFVIGKGEHIVANFFILILGYIDPVDKVNGPGYSVMQIIKNYIPCCIGNFAGGLLIAAMINSYMSPERLQAEHQEAADEVRRNTEYPESNCSAGPSILAGCEEGSLIR